MHGVVDCRRKPSLESGLFGAEVQRTRTIATALLICRLWRPCSRQMYIGYPCKKNSRKAISLCSRGPITSCPAVKNSRIFPRPRQSSIFWIWLSRSIPALPTLPVRWESQCGSCCRIIRIGDGFWIAAILPGTLQPGYSGRTARDRGEASLRMFAAHWTNSCGPFHDFGVAPRSRRLIRACVKRALLRGAFGSNLTRSCPPLTFASCEKATLVRWCAFRGQFRKLEYEANAFGCTKGKPGGAHHETRTVLEFFRHRNGAGFRRLLRPISQRLPDAASAHRRSVSRGRPDRLDRAADRAKTRRAARAIVLRGKRGGRQRCRRRGSGRARGAGRLHAPGLDQRLCRRFGDEHQPAVRSGEGFLAGQPHRHVAAGGGGQSVGAGKNHEGAGRPHQGGAG